MIHYLKPLKIVPVLFSAALVLLLSAGGFIQAQSDTPFRIEIGIENLALPGHYLTIPVVKAEGSAQIKGFDFMIAFDARGLTVYGVDPGELFEIPGVYEWEYFTYRIGPSGHCEGLSPCRTVRVMAVSDLNDGQHQPVSTSVSDGIVLYDLKFHLTRHRLYSCQFIPVRFFWAGCEDNTITISDSTGDITALSDHVYDMNGQYGDPIDITDFNGDLPSFSGAPDECLTSGIPANPVRFVDFVNGGVDIICLDDMMSTGDINLNDNTVEVGDAVLFASYFYYGISVFTINPEAQIYQTDVNGDGMTLTEQDYLFLLEVLIGDGLPMP